MRKEVLVTKLTRKGVFQRDARAAGGWRKVAPCIRIPAIATDPTQKNHFVEIRFRTIREKCRSLVLERSILQSEKFSVLKTKLFNAGYQWPRDKALSAAIWAALHDSNPSRDFTLVEVPGWHGEAFALPEGCIRANKKVRRALINETSIEHVGLFRVGDGNLSEWQREVARPARQSSPLRVSIAAAFAATMLRGLELDSFAVNWFGATSQGKSTTLKAAASVAGLLDEGGSLPTWGDTLAGFEGQAMGHRDCILPLDETGDKGASKMSLAEQAAALAFAIARNRPRTKDRRYDMRYGYGNREYRTIALSTSENALSDIAIKSGKKRLGGEEVRLIDVPACEPGSQGIFDSMPANSTVEEAKALVERIESAAKRYCGHPLRAFLTNLVTDPAWVHTARDHISDFRKEAPPLAETAAALRIQRGFAVIWAAAALAIDYEVLPWKKKPTLRAVKKCFYRAIDALQAPETAGAASLASQRSTMLTALGIKLNTGSFVSYVKRAAVDDSEKKRRLAADGFHIGAEIWVKNDIFESWFPLKEERDILRIAGIFKTKRPDTITREKKIRGIAGKPRYYVIDKEALRHAMLT